MTKTKYALILLGVMDLMLIIMHLTDYFILFLKPTGYLIPFVVNLIVLSVIGFRSISPKIGMVIVPIVSLPIIFIYGFIILTFDNSYTKIDSPYGWQSVVIEYRHATLGETTYFYNFYKTKFGLVGKSLRDQSIEMMVPYSDHSSGADTEGALGLGNEKWITKDTIRFSTWQGMKDVHLNPSQSISSEDIQDGTEGRGKLNMPQSSVDAADIEAFIERANNKMDGETIIINGNRLEIRYDKESDQSWIEVIDVNDEAAIPIQQCSRVVANEKQGYYMLEECTNQWEYALYPMPAY
ncbi:hypothetical protein [Lederbergia panacisoli]|uniref:hypothetical protein n=1 Tax=Lederbergia panacisoli TaxID=1255251 RepID=UPI00214B3DDA|nr:hypothetical protein [Lederbergia panacisoli]MCR2823325.1 hypothetical protein [Lederbergia panacisoli]